MLIAEFDTRRVWAHEGGRSCAHWLNWRCGLSLNAAREKIRVVHALQDLPLTREAFSSLENLVLLCHHHHQLLHEGGFSMQRHAETGLLYFFKPDGSWIDPKPEWIRADAVLANTEKTGWQWQGDVMDYGIAVDAIHYRHQNQNPQ